MLSSAGLDTDRLAAHGRLDAERQYQAWLKGVYCVVVGTILFNFFLAFANTNVFPISSSYVILCEMALLGGAFVLAASRSATFFTITALYLSYIAFLLTLRPELDFKAVRDFLIPVVFYFVGRNIKRIEDADRLVWMSVCIIIPVGLFEFFLIEIYTKIIDIFDYYVARGTLSADSNFVDGSNLFISSTRVQGRNFFEFLGTVRASSVFLEPVTMGNYGAFLCAWALFRSGMRRRMLLFFAAFLAVVLSDARFGMYVCGALIAVSFVSSYFPRIVWWFVPLFIAFALAIYGGVTSEVHWEDNFTGRLLLSSQMLDSLTIEGVLGVQPYAPFLADSGYAYSLAQVGLIGLIAMWTAFMFAPFEDPKALKYKAVTAIYIALLLTVSNSIYTIKLAGLFWIVAGAADVVSWDARTRAKSPAKSALRGEGELYK